MALLTFMPDPRLDGMDSRVISGLNSHEKDKQISYRYPYPGDITIYGGF